MSFIRVTLTLDFATAAEAADALAKLAGAGNVQSATTAAATTAKTGADAKPASKPKPKPEPEAKAEPKVKAEPKAEPADAKGDSKEPFPYATLQKAVLELVAVDPLGPKAILESFGLATFKGSDPSIWEAAKEALETALAAAKAGA